MRDYLKFYINGSWVDPVTPKTLDVINPATEGVAGRISMGSAADVDRAVKAARAAFASYSHTTVDERVALLERIIAEYQKRYADMAAAITEEMGAPAALSQKAQAAMGKLAALLGSVQETKAQVAWVRRTLRDGRPTSYKGGQAATTGYAEGLKGPNGYDHTLDAVFAALDRALQPPAPAEPRRPGRHVPPDQQNWGHVGAALTSGSDA